ncbi:hypothetical protein [Streptomyces aidingensis]|uniref:DUF7848 domain-containing protein n=1 Tax=Streptomyces aidingensis TaxID=910347 RepID=A0A1I1JJY0_9ACTN|nr:hypothetical protein [Streptomyces aidingensis]SFC48655.1 hypothetical protein SAMN05421773_103440 [Streptomyces aidingensis]
MSAPAAAEWVLTVTGPSRFVVVCLACGSRSEPGCEGSVALVDWALSHTAAAPDHHEYRMEASQPWRVVRFGPRNRRGGNCRR